jgi:hypothetical protein
MVSASCGGLCVSVVFVVWEEVCEGNGKQQRRGPQHLMISLDFDDCAASGDHAKKES